MQPTPTIHHSLLHNSGFDLYQAHTLMGIGGFSFLLTWVGSIALVEHRATIIHFLSYLWKRKTS